MNLTVARSRRGFTSSFATPQWHPDCNEDNNGIDTLKRNKKLEDIAGEKKNRKWKYCCRYEKDF